MAYELLVAVIDDASAFSFLLELYFSAAYTCSVELAQNTSQQVDRYRQSFNATGIILKVNLSSPEDSMEMVQRLYRQTLSFIGDRKWTLRWWWLNWLAVVSSGITIRCTIIVKRAACVQYFVVRVPLAQPDRQDSILPRWCLCASPGRKIRSKCHRCQLDFCNRLDQPQPVEFAIFICTETVLSLCVVLLSNRSHLNYLCAINSERVPPGAKLCLSRFVPISPLTRNKFEFLISAALDKKNKKSVIEPLCSVSVLRQNIAKEG